MIARVSEGTMLRRLALSRYRFYRLLAGVAVLSYAVIAIAAKPEGQIETFPFFEWSLFSYSTDQKNDVTLLIKSVNGHRLKKPTLFYDMASTLASDPGVDVRLNKTLDHWAYDILYHKGSDAAQIRSVVEQSFLSQANSVDYDLVILTYNPIRRLHTGKIDSVSVIGSFRKA